MARDSTTGNRVSTTAQTLGGLLTMVAVAYLAYGLFFVPSLYSDDWGQDIERVIAGKVKWVDFSQLRPLLFVPFLTQYHLFGLNITANYVILWSLYLASAFLIWRIAASFPSLRSDGFALLTALFFLLYPTNYAHMWLNMAHHYSGMLLAVLSAYLLLRYAGCGKAIYLVSSFVSLALSLGLYDGQLGISAAWPVLLFVAYRNRSALKRRLALFLPILVLGGLSALRALTYQNPDDFYAGTSIALEPRLVLSRLALGYKISLAWGWTETIRHYLPWIPGSKAAVLLLGAIVCTPVLMAGYLVRDRVRTASHAESTGSQRPSVRPYLLSCLVGLALIGAGYVPIVAVFEPNLSEIGSRFNLFASIGASLALASVLMIGSILVTGNGRRVKRVVVVAAIPFLLLGIVTQASVQYRTRIAWEEQKSLWQALFEKAPDFREETMVLVVLPGLEERSRFHTWWRSPLNANWDASAALRMFYGNSRLTADVLFPDANRFNEPTLTQEGVVNWQTRRATPYDRVVAFVFDVKTRQMNQLSSLPAGWIQGAGGTSRQDACAPRADLVELCTDCVLTERASNTQWRSLLGR